MNALWGNLEAEDKGHPRPNYEHWRGLLEPSGCEPWWELESLVRRAERLSNSSEAKETEKEWLGQARSLESEYLSLRQKATDLEKAVAKKGHNGSRVYIKDVELCAILHESLEVLGEALRHFDDEVYEVYVEARRHATAFSQ